MKRQEEMLAAIGINVARDDAKVPRQALCDAFGEASDPIVVLRPATPDVAKIRAKARHDTRGAVRTLTLFLDAVDRGYRFDDPMATEKIRALKQAAAILKRDSELVQILLED